MTLSGGDILYISQLESMLSYIPRNRLTLGGMVSRLSEAGDIFNMGNMVNILPLKVYTCFMVKGTNFIIISAAHDLNL